MEVVGPVLSAEAAWTENPAFFYNSEKEATFVALKLAQSLDGRIAASPGQRTNITGTAARREVHRLRAGFDAVLVGSETVRVDDPLLTVREDVPMRKAPARMVMDTRCEISPTAGLFRDGGSSQVIVFTSERAPNERVEGIQRVGAQVERLPEGPGGLALDALLERAWDMGVRSIFCEGGGRLAASFIRQRRANRLYLFLAPFVLGESGVQAFPDTADSELWSEWKRRQEPLAFGQDLLLTFDRKG
jgi:diaminohydroxyphosphoribosylaminopyrimidine deaminase/5-amino-6-(5-phosphoribosylamino)uracil reductase